jgi:hypothetical protein
LRLFRANARWATFKEEQPPKSAAQSKELGGQSDKPEARFGIHPTSAVKLKDKTGETIPPSEVDMTGLYPLQRTFCLGNVQVQEILCEVEARLLTKWPNIHLTIAFRVIDDHAPKSKQVPDGRSFRAFLMYPIANHHRRRTVTEA